MNEIVFLTLTVAFQGGVGLDGTQSSDNRAGVINQLDDHAIAALRNDQPQTRSLSTEFENLKGSQSQNDSSPLNPAAKAGKSPTLNRFRSLQNPAASQSLEMRSVNAADTPPSLNLGAFGRSRFQDRGLAGQVKLTQGNQLTVSNSSIDSARPAAFVPQEPGTNKALHWSNSNRVIENIDDQVRTVNSQSRFSDNREILLPNPTRETHAVGGTPVTSGSITGSNNPAEDFAQSSRLLLPENNPKLGHWTAVATPAQPASKLRAQLDSREIANERQHPLGTRFPNANNFEVPAKGPFIGSISQPSDTVGFSPTPAVTAPVTTASANADEVAALNQKIEELKAEQRTRNHETEIAKLKASQKDQLEKVIADFQKSQEKKDMADPATATVPEKSREASSPGSSSALASVFLVISLGFNVFLVVQYLSVQNQFRDLSNDLRDTFMSNHYE
ncbi:MAG: hypothetical protein VX438_18360 [Planctomycetota bacterium]|nr:hypothetical protein [Planctomycetota bacterium]